MYHRIPPPQATKPARIAGLACLARFDPMALFANFNYLHTNSQDFSDPSRWEPDDQLDITLALSAFVSRVFSAETRLRSHDTYNRNLAIT